MAPLIMSTGRNHLGRHAKRGEYAKPIDFSKSRGSLGGQIGLSKQQNFNLLARRCTRRSELPEENSKAMQSFWSIVDQGVLLRILSPETITQCTNKDCTRSVSFNAIQMTCRYSSACHPIAMQRKVQCS